MGYRFGYHGGYCGGSRSGGFTKPDGTHVSAARAHQHVGQSLGGVTKVRTPSGSFRMQKGK